LHHFRLVSDNRCLAVRTVGLLVIVVLAWASTGLMSRSGSAAAVGSLPPIGISLAALLLTTRRSWPAGTATVLLSDLIVGLRHQQPWTLALGLAISATVSLVAGAWCTQRLRGGSGSVDLS
jgi:hypothetical protein